MHSPNALMQPLVALTVLYLLCSTASAGQPAEHDAIAMAERAAALIKAQGKDEMIKRINARDPDFVKSSLYVGLRDIRTGIVLAHPYDRWIVGKSLLDVPDSNGKKYRREIIELAIAKGKGWVDYQYKDPASGRIETNTAYILRVDNLVLEADLYRK